MSFYVCIYTSVAEFNKNIFVRKIDNSLISRDLQNYVA